MADGVLSSGRKMMKMEVVVRESGCLEAEASTAGPTPPPS